MSEDKGKNRIKFPLRVYSFDEKRWLNVYRLGDNGKDCYDKSLVYLIGVLEIDLFLENDILNYYKSKIYQQSTIEQEFEKYPKLAELLLHAANYWKTDNTWSATLEQINNICRENTELKQQTASIIQQTLQYVAEHGKVKMYWRGDIIIDKQNILNMAPEIIKIIKC